jgi:hypothetical protein
VRPGRGEGAAAQRLGCWVREAGAMSAGMFGDVGQSFDDTGYTCVGNSAARNYIIVQRARETSGTSASCKSWPFPFLTRLALPDIREQYMHALQDPRMCIVQRGLSRSTQARAERI